MDRARLVRDLPCPFYCVAGLSRRPAAGVIEEEFEDRKSQSGELGR